MNEEVIKLILENQRMLLWENWRKYEIIRCRDHSEMSSVELNEIVEQVQKINKVLNPEQEPSLTDKTEKALGRRPRR